MENNMDNQTLEERVFRLETQMTDVQRNLGEVNDMAKNAHHRINETNNLIEQLKEEVRKGFEKFTDMFTKLGKKLAQKDADDKKWRKVLIIIGIIAVIAFAGQYIQDASIKSSVGDIALKVGAGVATTI